MGWWPFSSGPSAPTSPPESKPSSSQSDLLPPTTAAPSPGPSKPLSREQQADAELESFLASLEGSSRPKPATQAKPQHSTPSPPQPSSEPTSSWSNLWQRAPVSPPQPTDIPTEPSVPSTSESKLDISPRALRPRTMSCRAAFDSAFYCASLGGKFNDIYRFGSLQPCSEHWDAFWFCMRNRSISGDTSEEKGERIADYYEAREERERIRRAGGRSSEDIWEIRTEPVERAFWKVP
ncbi:hypothetical protein K461DRAFT_290986 [Myriangium duriaei CBS 260.36]|uniref:Early meiotic induction protein 1 n=1 Tax=Myriangium duriaei CBS 260.36 TaxID=1168546 RepID=A0A9P4J6Y2_9PEZI|nr:hypothetical protein K461DRAFT_290986 [Myriangium duriaei CBS 260.36]